MAGPGSREMYYCYAQTMEGRTQNGLVVCAHIEDYMSGKIKKHELTRKDKEETAWSFKDYKVQHRAGISLPIPEWPG